MSLNWDRIKQTNIEQVKRSDLGSQIDFMSCNSNLSNIRGLLIDSENIPTNNPVLQEKIADYGRRFLKIMGDLEGFHQGNDETTTDAIARRNSLINEVYRLEFDLQGAITPLVLYRRDYEPKYKEVEGRLNDLNESAQRAQNQVDQGVNRIQQAGSAVISEIQKGLLKEAGQILEDVKSESVRVAEIRQSIENTSIDRLTEKYGLIFSNQASKYGAIAKASLILFISLVLATLIYSYFSFTGLSQKFGAELWSFTGSILSPYLWGFIIVNLLERLSIITLFLVLVWESLKNYNINMHLAALNQHRHNALCSSLQILSLTGNDPQLRGSVTEKIAELIYGSQTTGYLSENKKGPTLTEITELLKAVRSG